ncbi:hypothetical protein [Bacillus sinesaloumensis]|nr:hypothetical protein [Bacillus sinesaloumensis]
MIITFIEPTAIIGLIMGAVFFPVAFRIIMGILSKVNNVEREI